MKRMLMVVSLGFLALIAVLAWTYAKTFPEIRNLRRDAEYQHQRAEEASLHLAESCVKLATLQNARIHDFDGASQTLDQCMAYFPDQPGLPAYKAYVMTQWFEADHSKPVRLEYALQAADTSFAKAKARNIAAPEYAYEGKILASCLQAQFGPDDTRSSARATTIDTFKEAVQVHEQLAVWAQSQDVKGACTQDVISSLHP